MVSVNQRVVDASVPQDLYDVENVFRLVIFHCCFVVSECVEVNLR